jgi:two-component system LytT family response regulator
MRILIVEDSLEDLLNLRSLLESMVNMNLCATAHTLEAARVAVKNHDPELVFLDIELGQENGFDLLDHLPAHTQVIFTTVHTGYGAAAFDVDAVDYVIKPVSEERLLRAMAKLHHGDNQPMTRMLIYRGGGERHTLALETIAAIIADRDYSIVICGNRRYHDHRRFREWIELLRDKNFTQLDRSTLVRMDLIQSWQPYGAGLRLKFRHVAETMEIGRAAAKRFEELAEGQISGPT